MYPDSLVLALADSIRIANGVLPVVKTIPTPFYVILAFYLLGILGLVVRIMSKCPDVGPAAMWAYFLTKLGSLVKQSLSWLLVYGLWISMRWWIIPNNMAFWVKTIQALTWQGAYWAAPFVAWLADSILKSILTFISKLVASRTGEDVPIPDAAPATPPHDAPPTPQP
jgi:hypothetical protein